MEGAAPRRGPHRFRARRAPPRRARPSLWALVPFVLSVRLLHPFAMLVPTAPLCSRILILGILFGLVLGLNTESASGQVPRLLHYQATLVEGDFPAEGDVRVEAAFFADSTGGSPLSGWTETRTDVPLMNGHLSLLLGSQEPLPDVLFETSPLYLQLAVNDEPLPRLRLASTAFALRAGATEAVSPGSVGRAALAEEAVTTDALANGAVTAPVLAAASVTAPALADGAVTAAKVAPAAVSTNALADGAVTSAKLGASAVVGSVLADGAVTTGKLANGSVTASKVATGAVVTSLNGLTDAVRLVAGENVTITPGVDAATITISADDNGERSSRRWKTNIRPLDGLDLVRQLRGVRYHWKESGIPDVGLIAEEVGTVVPEVVTYAPNGEDAESVNYAKLVALLIEAVKTQQAQIEADRARLSALAARLDALEQSTAGPDVHGAGAQN